MYSLSFVKQKDYKLTNERQIEKERQIGIDRQSDRQTERDLHTDKKLDTVLSDKFLKHILYSSLVFYVYS